MRLRLPVLASACVAAACAATPALASAAPVADHALTIHATPNHIVAGEPVLIFGRLEGRRSADQEVVLWHRISGQSSFTIISRTKTDSAGRYEFTRAQDVVNTNRNWFVRGPVFTHSKTIHERVAAELTLASSATTGTTRHPLTFTGTVTPDHTGDRIALQVQNGDGDQWHTVKVARIGAGSSFSIAEGWRTAGERNVRVAFRGDARNTPAVSDPVSVVINQTQAPYFTIGSSDPIAANGSTETISGALDLPHTSTPSVGTEVGLYARVPQSAAPLTLVQTTSTDGSGAYSFNVAPTTNELYQARTITASPAQASAVVFQGVQDTVTMSSTAASSTVGGSVTFNGTVAPSKSGHVVYLEKLGRDGHWQVVETSTVTDASTFSFNWTFGAAGTKQFRARVLGGPVNVGGASAPVTESVAQAPLASLPTS